VINHWTRLEHLPTLVTQTVLDKDTWKTWAYVHTRLITRQWTNYMVQVATTQNTWHWQDHMKQEH